MKRIRMMYLPACLRLWPWLLLLSLTAAGCIYDKYPDGEGAKPEEPVPVTIRLVTRFGRESKDAFTRGLSEEDEGRVDDVYVFFLRVSDGKVHSVVEGKDVNTTDTETTFTANLEVAGSAGQEFRCIVLANAGGLLDGQTLIPYKDKTYDQIQKMLVSGEYITAPPVLAAGGFVMWGEAKETVSATRRPQKVTVNMLRSLARVDIGVGDKSNGSWDGTAAGNVIPFKLMQVLIFKPNNQYAFMPLAGAYDADARRVIKPSPAGAVNSTPFTYDIPSGATSFAASIYLPEAAILHPAGGETVEHPQSGDANHTRRCAVIVKGSYNNKTPTYYRIDFHSGTQLVDLLRNHRYQASITAVSGDGEATAQEAYESRRVNIAATVLGWNDWSQDVIFDGTDHVYVERKSILLPGNKDQTGTIGIESSVESAEWQMSLNGADFSTDKTVSNTDFEVTKPDGKAGRLLIKTLTKLEVPEGTDPDTKIKTATLRVKIRRLEFEISIRQIPDTPEDWVEGGDVPKDF